MADPRVYTPDMLRQIAKDKHRGPSDLMQAKAEMTTGGKVNACPFDLSEEHLDSNGYCKHLVGFANDIDPAKVKTFMPMIFDEKTERRHVGVKRGPSRKDKQTGEEIAGKMERVPDEPIREGDQIVPITTCSRVYRNVS
jgi:hypothetical protein